MRKLFLAIGRFSIINIKIMTIMNRALLIFAAAGSLLLSGCDNREKIEGAWESSPMKLDVPGTATSSATLSYVFNQDGSVAMSSDINLTEPMNKQVDEMDMAYQVSVSATASIRGTWQYAHDENDEVVIVLDDNSFSLNIDPEAVTFSQNLLDGQQAPETEAMKQQAMEKYNAMLTPTMKAYFTRFGKLDDIKVQKDFLNCEIGDHDYIFRAL